MPQTYAQASLQPNFKTVSSKTGLSHITLRLWVLPTLCIPTDPDPQHIILLCDSHLLPFTEATVWAEQGRGWFALSVKHPLGDFQEKCWNIPNTWDQTNSEGKDLRKSPPQSPTEAIKVFPTFSLNFSCFTLCLLLLILLTHLTVKRLVPSSQKPPQKAGKLLPPKLISSPVHLPQPLCKG